MMARPRETGEDIAPTPLHRRWRDLRAWRLNLGLCLGPIAMGFLYSVLAAFAGLDDLLSVVLGVFILSVGLALVGGWLYLLVVVRSRRRIARIECLLLGVVLTVLLPLAAFLAVIADEQQSLGELFSSTELLVIVVGGLILISLGLFSGWLFWRFGVRPSWEEEIDAVAGSPLARERKWRDLSAWRLSLGLIPGPVLLAILMALTYADRPPGKLAIIVSGVLFGAGAWSLIGGWIYLLLSIRRRGLLRRRDCLWLGVGLMELLLLVPISFRLAQDGLIVLYEDVQSLFFMIAFALLFGLLSGWLFWRIGVRPANLPEPDISVFD